MATHDPYAALRNRPFLWTLLAQILTIGGSQAQATVIGWLIYLRTGSAAMLGLAGLAVFLPVLLLSLPVGHWVDAYSRKMLFMLGECIALSAGILLLLFSVSAVPVGWLYLALIISGAGNAFIAVARPALMRDAMPVHQAENGANWTSMGRRIASILGPVLAGVLIAWNGASPGFVAVAVLYFLALICTFFIQVPMHPLSGEVMSVRSLTEGIRYIRDTPIILSTTLLDMFAVLLGGATGLLPIYASDILHVGATGLGVLRAAPYIGSGITAFIMAHRRPLRRAGKALLISVALFGVMTIGFGLSTIPVLSFIFLFFTGVCDAVSVTVRSTILHVFVPNRLRGRVFGINMVFVYSSNELGDFESGMAASLLGTMPSVVLGGFGSIAMAWFFGWKWKELRELGRIKVQPDIE